MKNPFIEISQVVESILNQNLPKPSDNLCVSLANDYKQMVSHVNYNKYSNSFTSKYWLRNYWKTAYALEYLLDINKYKTICSLGAGSGADTVACITAANSSSRQSFTLIDQSTKQLQTASLIINHLSPIMLTNSFRVNYINENILDLDSSQKCDLLLLSHLLTENSDILELLVRKIITLLNPKGEIFIIERQRDPVWQQALIIFTKLKKFQITSYDIDLNKLKGFNIHYSDITPHYLLIKSI